ncbi:vesicle-associated protein 1-3-like [Papaver somniferum]|uniref:vesicle-associated protein 1-3-like n=1 Tax=Papaver somniferum TaxID=3469 RepID=UPI000E6FC7B3|nr:vesicle-associated protein 1-3-like [Papaver somniferum]
MGAVNLSNIQPALDLKFPFELYKHTWCSLQLTNKSDEYVAFKVNATDPKKYCVRPNVGIVLPGTTYNVAVTMRAPQAQEDMLQCKDEFLVQSVILRDMFNKGKYASVVNLKDFKLRVVYVPANPLQEVPQRSEQAFKFKVTYNPAKPVLRAPQGSSASRVENESPRSSWFDVVASLLFRDKSMSRSTAPLLAPLLDNNYENTEAS